MDKQKQQYVIKEKKTINLGNILIYKNYADSTGTYMRYAY